MIVDSNRQLITVGEDKEQILKLNEQARLCRYVSHYTSADAFLNILDQSMWKASCLNNYEDEECELDEEMRKIIFSLSFSTDINENYYMWERYGNGGDGIKIDLEFIDCFEKFLKKTIVKAFNEKETSVRIRHMSYSPTNEGRPFVEDIFCEYIFARCAYEEDKTKLRSFINIDGKPYLLINQVAYKKGIKYYRESEVRAIVYFKSFKEARRDDFSYLMIPIDFFEVKNIRVTFGNKMSEKKKESVKDKIFKTSKEKYPNVVIDFANSRLKN